ncbi:MAG: HTH domain-containing protein [Rectinemataceae bacterium]|nr:HTH domain-containing protein [Rectinemataceae bacterium]
MTKLILRVFVILSEKMSEKMSEKILSALRNDSKLTIASLANQFGVTTRTIERTLKKLQEENRLSRIGQDKGGHWKVGG